MPGLRHLRFLEKAVEFPCGWTWAWRLCAFLSLSGVLCCFAFLGHQSGPRPFLEGYYPALANSFLDGRVDLGHLEVCKKLQALPDPYDAAATEKIRRTEGVHDLSFYKGKLYMYFGPVPALLLFVPWKLLTGSELPQAHAVIFFCGLGYLICVALFLKVLSIRAEGLGAPIVVAALWVLGLSTGLPYLLVRPFVYEVAISCGFCLVSLALYGAVRYLLSKQRGTGWLLLCSLCFGLSLGARPSLLPGACFVLGAVFVVRHGRALLGLHVPPLSECLALVFPFSFCLAGLAFYNLARFGNPLEFGVTYQLGGITAKGVSFFIPQAFPYNVFAYFFSAPVLADHFPFVMPRGWEVIRWSETSVPHMIEFLSGLFVAVPLTALGLAGALCLFRRSARVGPLRYFVLAALVFGLVCFTPFAFACGGSLRYLPDFAPWLVLSSLWTLVLWRDFGLRSPALLRSVLRTVCLLCCLISVIVTGLQALQFRGHVRAEYPRTYRFLARLCNAPVAALDRRPFGPIEAELVFPDCSQARLEVLVLSLGYPSGGMPLRREGILVDYQGSGAVRFLYVNSNLEAPLAGQSFKPVPGHRYRLRVDYGALYPGEGQPWYESRSVEQRATSIDQASLSLDDRVVLQATGPSIEAYSIRPTLGQVDEEVGGLGFSGTIIDAHPCLHD